MIARSPTISPWRAVSFFVPLASILVAVLMMPLPFGVQVWGVTLMPSLPLIAIFLWTVYRPDLLPPAAVLFFGVLYDFLVHGPIGASSFVFLAVYAITLSQRVYWMTLQGSGLIGGFFFVALIAEFLLWALTSFSAGRMLSLTPALIEALISILFLPLVRRVFLPLERLVGPGVE
jgi:rod shape-determining protein MreD